MGNACHGKLKEDPDSAWKQQNEESEENPMYKYITLNNKGTLIAAYNEGGPELVEEIARREIEPYLYNGGKGAMISKLEYIKWCRRRLAKSAGYVELDTKSDESILEHFEEDEFNKFEPHEACWDLNKRGGVGETPFHLAHLMDSPVHSEVCKILVRMYPKLTLDVYEGEEYFGESALHIAVVQGDFERVKILTENGAKVNQRATGRFFLPEDQKKSKSKKTNFDGYAYYGEYPLAFAACVCHQDIYDYLIEHKADPNLQDSFGNTVLHMVVIADQPTMYRYAVCHHERPANTHIKNKYGLTPLTLASKLGRHTIFKEMLELDSLELWRYSNILCSAYPLTSLDSIGPKGDTNWNSALMIIVNGETEEHLDMLEGGVIRQLLDEKWKTFARRRFILRLVIAIIHLALISVIIYTRPEGTQLLGFRGTIDIMRYTAEVLVCLGCFSAIMVDGISIGSQGFKPFIRNCMHAPAQTVNMMSSLLILLCIPFRILKLNTVEDILLIIAIPGSWFFLLFFARGVKLTGPFVTMIYKMIKGDLFRFALIYLIFLVGFTQGFFFLFRDVDTDNSDVQKFSTLEDTVMNLFQMTLGEFKYEAFNYARYPQLTKIVFAFFMFLVPILLLNMLIAMMGNTYTQVISKSEKEWRKQWAKIVVVLERGFSKKQLLKFQQEYAVKIAGPPTQDNQKTEARALVVIKATSKTKAKQRKAAISNWKRVGKEIVTQLKEARKRGQTVDINLLQNRTRPTLTQIESTSFEDEKLSALDPFGQTFSSTVAQLAWERDIDLTKGKTFISDPEVMDKISPRGHDMSPIREAGQTNIPNGRPKQVERIMPSGPILGSPKSRKPMMYSNRVFPLIAKSGDGGSGDLLDGACIRSNTEKVETLSHKSPTKSVFSVSSEPWDKDTVSSAMSLETLQHEDEDGRGTTTEAPVVTRRKKEKRKRKKSSSPMKSSATNSQSSLTPLLKDDKGQPSSKDSGDKERPSSKDSVNKEWPSSKDSVNKEWPLSKNSGDKERPSSKDSGDKEQPSSEDANANSSNA
ncbi:transient receptor potential cation channel subfamily V member 6-like [Haliotis rufescens]|uniref:transient receptor potential cation channel subfamily V member 6-like n=1 Tax=Haliotis rufescens TaxID=6454 RepID=UPI00201F72F9|nr:transient receptor potential cation channel subfamily V member 6-like [Haliotis rufescens]